MRQQARCRYAVRSPGCSVTRKSKFSTASAYLGGWSLVQTKALRRTMLSTLVASGLSLTEQRRIQVQVEGQWKLKAPRT